VSVILRKPVLAYAVNVFIDGLGESREFDERFNVRITPWWNLVLENTWSGHDKWTV